jgi:hypothetical protein
MGKGIKFERMAWVIVSAVVLFMVWFFRRSLFGGVVGAKDGIVTAFRLGDTIGKRLRNVMCLRFNPANDWNGQVRGVDGFVEFVDYYAGVRAGCIVLRTYRDKYGLDTLATILERWAPHGYGENNPVRYALTCSSRMGVRVDTRLGSESYPALVCAIADIESGAILDREQVADLCRGVGL